ncbi:MAG: hypothetical protein M8364_16035 [Methylobacter sp.]|uniref:hypothetical protein n=1 Tax=Methylobacter sp. TaxID=2051955 RepID=UPI00258F57FE|nr:hypothetical protein [Methylobacter sp.]MCL7422401.1 hypothetical protein [Methylobacter sp.]
MTHPRNMYVLTLTLFLLGSFPAAAVERPFSLHGEGNVTFTGGNPPTGGDITVTGTGTHLGNWAGAGMISFSPGLEPHLILASSQQTFMAASGDELYVEFVDAELDTSTGIATGVFLFVGGTGRFKAASGSADFVVIQDPSGPFELTTTGVIDF